MNPQTAGLSRRFLNISNRFHRIVFIHTPTASQLSVLLCLALAVLQEPFDGAHNHSHRRSHRNPARAGWGNQAHNGHRYSSDSRHLRRIMPAAGHQLPHRTGRHPAGAESRCSLRVRSTSRLRPRLAHSRVPRTGRCRYQVFDEPAATGCSCRSDSGSQSSPCPDPGHLRTYSNWRRSRSAVCSKVPSRR